MIDQNLVKEIDKIADSKANLISAYTKSKADAIKESIEQIENSYKNFKGDIEKSFYKAKESNEYSDYIKYLVSEDYEKKQKDFIEKVEKTIIDNLPKKNNNLLYIYIAIGIIFVLQILLFIVK